MTADDALFDVPELAADITKLGRAEAGLIRAVRAGEVSGTLIAVDAAAVGAALIAARALDRADKPLGLGNVKDGYLVAQLLTPYREMLHSLRLPAALTPAAPPPPDPGNGQDQTPDWLRDAFGTAE